MNDTSSWMTFIQSGGGKLIGMSLAYIASFMGLAFAWYNYRKRHPKNEKEQKNG